MLIYLVQSATDLDGSDGYSYGLLRGDHHRVLVSFETFQRVGQTSLLRFRPDRRLLVTRMNNARTKARTGRKSK